MNMRIAIWIFSITFLIGFNQSNFAQTKSIRISGQIFSPSKSPISNANIQLKLALDGNTVTFVRSDENGKFSLAIPNETALNSYSILITHIAYEELILPLKDDILEYEISLKDKIASIAEVSVGVRPRVSLRGDTIAYAMSSFAKPEDRSVADVLKRMPGFAISNDGKISYNGQQVSTLYIGRDDLMGNRYGLATRAVPHNLVLDVEVLRNHQPIQVLKDRVFSNSVAVNLVIKDEAKLKTSGEGSLGGGFPGLYEVRTNLMQFNDKIKYLHGLQSNNGGDRIDAEVFNDELSGMVGGQNLSIGTISKPNLPHHRTYNNLSGVLSTNQLLTLKNEWKWKVGIDGFIDKETTESQLKQYLIAHPDDLLFTEQKRQEIRPKMLQFDMNLYQNVPNRFVEINTKAFYSKLDARGAYENESLQQLNSKNLRFQQRFKFIPKLNSQDVLTIEGNFTHAQKPSELNVGLNDSFSYPLYDQELDIANTSTMVSLRYHLKPKIIIQNYSAGISMAKDRLLSKLDSMGHTNVAQNRLHWTNASIFANAQYALNLQSLQFNLSIPLSQQYISYTNSVFGSSQKRSDIVFTPVFRVKFAPDNRNEWTTEYRFIPSFSSLFGVNEGVIMWNFRDFRRMNIGIQRQTTQMASLNYRFNHLPSMSIGHFSYSYSITNAGSLPKLKIEDHAISYESVELANQSNRHQIMVGFDTYIKAFRANSSFNYQWSRGQNDYLLGDQLMVGQHTMHQIRWNVNARLNNSIAIGYIGVLSAMNQNSFNDLLQNQTSLDRNRGIGLINQDHQLHLSYAIQRKHFINLKSYLLNSNRSQNATGNFYFLDASIRTRLSKYRVDLELGLRNLTNVKRYYSAYFNEQWVFYNDFELRGRQGLLSATYMF